MPCTCMDANTVAREARQRGWNEAERADANPKARIATEIEVGLPHKLTDTQRKELLSAFVGRIVEKHGVFADAAIHTAHDERNIHAHVLLSHRELGPEGFGEIANRRTATRKHRGQVKEMTTAGIAATPADIRKLREQWAQDVNRAYEKAGLDIRVDHRKALRIAASRNCRRSILVRRQPEWSGAATTATGATSTGSSN